MFGSQGLLIDTCFILLLFSVYLLFFVYLFILFIYLLFFIYFIIICLFISIYCRLDGRAINGSVKCINVFNQVIDYADMVELAEQQCQNF